MIRKVHIMINGRFHLLPVLTSHPQSPWAPRPTHNLWCRSGRWSHLFHQNLRAAVRKQKSQPAAPFNRKPTPSYLSGKYLDTPPFILGIHTHYFGTFTQFSGVIEGQGGLFAVSCSGFLVFFLWTNMKYLLLGSFNTFFIILPDRMKNPAGAATTNRLTWNSQGLKPPTIGNQPILFTDLITIISTGWVTSRHTQLKQNSRMELFQQRKVPLLCLIWCLIRSNRPNMIIINHSEPLVAVIHHSEPLSNHGLQPPTNDLQRSPTKQIQRGGRSAAVASSGMTQAASPKSPSL